MFDIIRADLSKNPDSKDIVFGGLSHFIDTWELGKYSRGLFRRLVNDSTLDVKVRGSYFVYTNEDDVAEEAKDRLNACHPVIVAHLQLINSENEFLTRLTTNLESQADALFKREQLSSVSFSDMQEYFIYSFDKGLNNATSQYIGDMGGRILAYEGDFIKIRFSSHLLRKEVRKFLSLDRIMISLVNDKGLQYLRDNVSGLTIEEAKFKSGGDGLLLTFLCDEGFRSRLSPGTKLHRDHIDFARRHFLAYLYTQV